MKINTLRIRNYKGFKDSGDIHFGSGFNVIVGQNNSGKTAMLETLRLRSCESRPYRGLSTQLNLPAPLSLYELQVSVTGNELKTAVIVSGAQFYLPVSDSRANDSQGFTDEIFAMQEISLRFSVSHNGAFESLGYPSHGLFVDLDNRPERFIPIQRSADQQTVIGESLSGGRHDTLANALTYNHQSLIYVFEAKRFSLGSCANEETGILRSDATNLPAVLLWLRRNPHDYDKFIQHIREIFPSIKNVIVTQLGNTQLSIQIWMVDPSSGRNDLLIKLEDCGTGIGQVLAILYVAMTSTSNVIAIDEPNSFLHPGAAKKLIQILKQYKNQYIISTHSPEIIAVADPDTIHQISWDGEQSVIKEYNRESVEDMHHLLSDIGVNLSDVFGADQVVWVEGHTEEQCFPLILAQASPADARRVSFVRLRNTGDLKPRSRSKAQMVWDIYENLTKGGGILPPVLAFNLDMEDLSAQEQQDLLKLSGGKLKFLPRVTYENYLLHADAIADVMNAEFSKHGVDRTITAPEVEAWIIKNGTNYEGLAKWQGDYLSGDWVTKCSGANLLGTLFEEHKLQYKKTSHSVELTKWLLSNAAGHLAELTAYVCNLVGVANCSPPLTEASQSPYRAAP